MCGLYSFRTSPEEVRATFGYAEDAQFPPRDYVAPGQLIAIVRVGQATPEFALVRWGLIPSWVKQPKPGKPLINARSETIFEKPSFRSAIRRRRCLIPADGFYEWRGDIPGKKQPFHVTRPDGDLFAFAGIWEHWMAADGSELETAAIITTAANDTLTPVHHRMPVVINPADHAIWLNAGETQTGDVAAMLKPAANDYFIVQPTTIKRPVRAKPVASGKSTDQLKLI